MTGSRGRRVLGSPPPCSPEFGREVTSCSFHVKGEPRVGSDVSLLERSAPIPAPSQPHVVGTRGDSHRLFCWEHLRFPQKKQNLVQQMNNLAWTRVRRRRTTLKTPCCSHNNRLGSSQHDRSSLRVCADTLVPLRSKATSHSSVGRPLANDSCAVLR